MLTFTTTGVAMGIEDSSTPYGESFDDHPFSDQSFDEVPYLAPDAEPRSEALWPWESFRFEEKTDEGTAENGDAPEEDSLSWDYMLQVVHSLAQIAATEPSLGRVYEDAVNLQDAVNLSYWLGADGSSRDGLQCAHADLASVLASACNLAISADEAICSTPARSKIDAHLARLTDWLDDELGLAMEPNSPSAPLWLDVASPGHSYVSVTGTQRHYRAGRAHIDRAATLVKANDCELANEDHYHVRRVALDCEGIYADQNALEAFVTALLDPCPENFEKLHERLILLAASWDQPGEQLLRLRLSPDADTFAYRPGVVFMEDGSKVYSQHKYYIHETRVPLVELLVLNPHLIEELVYQYRYGNPTDTILRALGQVDDDEVLEYASRSKGEHTTITNSGDGFRVGLAAAVMIGYGNRLTATTAVETGRATKGNIGRFDRMVRRRVNAALQSYRKTPSARGNANDYSNLDLSSGSVPPTEPRGPSGEKSFVMPPRMMWPPSPPDSNQNTRGIGGLPI
jgi:hypothetical protein